MIKAVLLDLDGTLLDTVEDIRASLNEALAAFSYPALTREQTCRFIGDGAYKLVERAVPAGTDNAEECYELFHKLYAANDGSRTRAFDGAEAFLKACKARGVKTAVVTNKPQDATFSCVKRFFQTEFDFVGGDSGSFPCKPDPTLALYAALTMRVAPAECAFVGDGETDVLTAKRAGMKGVAVLWGYRSKEQLEGAGAKRFVTDFTELQDLIFTENF